MIISIYFPKKVKGGDSLYGISQEPLIIPLWIQLFERDNFVIHFYLSDLRCGHPDLYMVLERTTGERYILSHVKWRGHRFLLDFPVRRGKTYIDQRIRIKAISAS